MSLFEHKMEWLLATRISSELIIVLPNRVRLSSSSLNRPNSSSTCSSRWIGRTSKLIKQLLLLLLLARLSKWLETSGIDVQLSRRSVKRREDRRDYLELAVSFLLPFSLSFSRPSSRKYAKRKRSASSCSFNIYTPKALDIPYSSNLLVLMYRRIHTDTHISRKRERKGCLCMDVEEARLVRFHSHVTDETRRRKNGLALIVYVQ